MPALINKRLGRFLGRANLGDLAIGMRFSEIAAQTALAGVNV